MATRYFIKFCVSVFENDDDQTFLTIWHSRLRFSGLLSTKTVIRHCHHHKPLRSYEKQLAQICWNGTCQYVEHYIATPKRGSYMNMMYVSVNVLCGKREGW